MSTQILLLHAAIVYADNFLTVYAYQIYCVINRSETVKEENGVKRKFVRIKVKPMTICECVVFCFCI